MESKNCFEIRLRCQSYDKALIEDLKRKLHFFMQNQKLQKNLLKVSFVRLPVKKKRITVLRSPHVNKKSREQLEVRLHNALFILNLNFFHKSFLQTLIQSYDTRLSVKINFNKVSCIN